MKIKDLFEVIAIHPINRYNEPLRDVDTIKVYHGTTNLELVYLALSKGITGDKKIFRVYSYENNNNPRGIFVTPDIKTAKYFGDYIIEFHCKVSDLESPVWPSGSFTIMGQASDTFRNKEEREIERQRQRELYTNSDDENIAKSDRPELAGILLRGNERQALFVGNINSNGIKAIWVSDFNTSNSYTRMSPRKFLQVFKEKGISTRNSNKTITVLSNNQLVRDSKKKIGKPRDKMNWDNFYKAFITSPRYSKSELSREEFDDIFKNNPDEIRDYVWNDTQYQDILRTMK